MVDWSTVFDEAYPVAGASRTEISDFVKTVGQPLSKMEIQNINRSQSNPFPEDDPLHAKYKPFDPSLWVILARPVPPAYLAFLRWSNGGEFRKGERWLQMTPADEVRDDMLAYHVPQYMPGVLPFALNGGGVFYMFDMRKPAMLHEFPILCCSAANLGFDARSSPQIAASFIEACCGSVNVDDILYP